jgi:predicted GNAT family N-acyltransferase
MIEVRLATTPEDVRTCLRLRWTVFVEEQGVPPSLEKDEHDTSDAVHALALYKGVPSGAGRFTWLEPGVAKIQRMAVIDDVRGHGVGHALLAFLEHQALRRGAKGFTLGAQLTARKFYEKAGYSAQGPVFDDAGIQHVRMDKPGMP